MSAWLCAAVGAETLNAVGAKKKLHHDFNLQICHLSCVAFCRRATGSFGRRMMRAGSQASGIEPGIRGIHGGAYRSFRLWAPVVYVDTYVSAIQSAARP